MSLFTEQCLLCKIISKYVGNLLLLGEIKFLMDIRIMKIMKKKTLLRRITCIRHIGTLVSLCLLFMSSSLICHTRIQKVIF